MATTIPPFLVGPAGALLVNTNGFSARLTLNPPDATDKVHSLSGRLLCQGSRLIFAPSEGDRTFLWDVQQHRGYILSDALQGYAPISSPLQITNVSIIGEATAPSANQVNGHPGHESEVAVASNDGSSVTFTVWCAADLNDFPVRIKSLNAPESFNLNLYDLRSETFAPKLFLPPVDFARYDSPEAMTSELSMRKAKLRNTGTEPRREIIPMPTPGIH